jgi:hypothetical protein
LTRRKRTKALRDRAFSGSVDVAALPSAKHVHVPSKTLRGDVALLNMLTAIKQESVDLDAKLTREVRRARRAGVSWERIGAALGISVQAASQRWGPYPVDAPRVPRRDSKLSHSTPTG